MPPLVEAHDLTKRFGDFIAVDGVEFTIEAGEAFGFLGPNGAGKTLDHADDRCVSPVTEGTLRVLGVDPRSRAPRIRARLGVVPQEDTLDTELTVEENLYIYGRYFDLPGKAIRERIDELLDIRPALPSARTDKVEPLSGGMKRRLTIARVADQPAGAGDPRRAHHRSRSAGPPPACGTGSTGSSSRAPP